MKCETLKLQIKGWICLNLFFKVRLAKSIIVGTLLGWEYFCWIFFGNPGQRLPGAAGVSNPGPSDFQSDAMTATP